MTVDRKSVLSGAIFALIGTAFASNAYFELPIGTALRMGPGYFPLLLSAVLVVLGLTIVVGALGAPTDNIGKIPWRGLGCIVVAPVVFGITARPLGLELSLFVAAAIAAFASRRMTPLLATFTALALVVFCTATFVIALRLPVPTLIPWRTLIVG